MPPYSDLLAKLGPVVEPNRAVCEGWHRTCSSEVDEDARRAVETLFVKRHFGVELDCNAHDIRQYDAADVFNRRQGSSAADLSVDGTGRSRRRDGRVQRAGR